MNYDFLNYKFYLFLLHSFQKNDVILQAVIINGKRQMINGEWLIIN